MYISTNHILSAAMQTDLLAFCWYLLVLAEVLSAIVWLAESLMNVTRFDIYKVAYIHCHKTITLIMLCLGVVYTKLTRLVEQIFKGKITYLLSCL